MGAVGMTEEQRGRPFGLGGATGGMSGTAATTEIARAQGPKMRGEPFLGAQVRSAGWSTGRRHLWRTEDKRIETMTKALRRQIKAKNKDEDGDSYVYGTGTEYLPGP